MWSCGCIFACSIPLSWTSSTHVCIVCDRHMTHAPVLGFHSPLAAGDLATPSAAHHCGQAAAAPGGGIGRHPSRVGSPGVIHTCTRPITGPGSAPAGRVHLGSTAVTAPGGLALDASLQTVSGVMMLQAYHLAPSVWFPEVVSKRPSDGNTYAQRRVDHHLHMWYGCGMYHQAQGSCRPQQDSCSTLGPLSSCQRLLGCLSTASTAAPPHPPTPAGPGCPRPVAPPVVPAWPSVAGMSAMPCQNLEASRPAHHSSGASSLCSETRPLLAPPRPALLLPPSSTRARRHP